MSSLFSHTESVLPFAEIIFKGVTPIESRILSWPFKKSVTGKTFSVCVELFVEGALFFLPEHAVKKVKKQVPETTIIFASRKITNKKNRCRVRSNGFRKNELKKIKRRKIVFIIIIL